VLLCSPASDPPDLTVVIGINDGDLLPEHRIVSNSSCTAHAAAPVLRLLEEAFGIERVFLSSVHAYTNQQRLADVPTEDLRAGRAAAENIIPQETNAPQILEGLLPSLRGRIRGLAMNVPVPNGSVVDMVCWHPPVTNTAINEVAHRRRRSLPGILVRGRADRASDILHSS
jgi:glyceraldehyde 3-phosphate dehydrogenase